MLLTAHIRILAVICVYIFAAFALIQNSIAQNISLIFPNGQQISAGFDTSIRWTSTLNGEVYNVYLRHQDSARWNLMRLYTQQNSVKWTSVQPGKYIARIDRVTNQGIGLQDTLKAFHFVEKKVPFVSAYLTPDARQFLVMDQDSLSVYRAADNSLISAFPHPEKGMSIIAGDNNNQNYIIAASGRPAAYIRNMQSNETLIKINDLFGRKIYWSPDDQYLLSTVNGYAGIWRKDDGIRLLTLRISQDSVQDAVWSPDQSKIAAGTMLGNVQIFDANTGAAGLKINAHNWRIRSIHWAQNRIITCGADSTIKIWDAINGNLLHSFRHDKPVMHVQWDKQGSRFFFSEFGPRIFMINYPSMDIYRIIHTWEKGEYYKLQTSRDDNTILAMANYSLSVLSSLRDSIYESIAGLPVTAVKAAIEMNNIDMEIAPELGKKDSAIMGYISPLDNYSTNIKAISSNRKNTFIINPLRSSAEGNWVVKVNQPANIQVIFKPEMIGLDTGSIQIITGCDTSYRSIRGICTSLRYDVPQHYYSIFTQPGNRKDTTLFSVLIRKKNSTGHITRISIPDSLTAGLYLMQKDTAILQGGQALSLRLRYNPRDTIRRIVPIYFELSDPDDQLYTSRAIIRVLTGPGAAILSTTPDESVENCDNPISVEQNVLRWNFPASSTDHYLQIYGIKGNQIEIPGFQTDSKNLNSKGSADLNTLSRGIYFIHSYSAGRHCTIPVCVY
jgi:WD40 repeat protein